MHFGLTIACKVITERSLVHSSSSWCSWAPGQKQTHKQTNKQKNNKNTTWCIFGFFFFQKKNGHFTIVHPSLNRILRIAIYKLVMITVSKLTLFKGKFNKLVSSNGLHYIILVYPDSLRIWAISAIIFCDTLWEEKS